MTFDEEIMEDDFWEWWKYRAASRGNPGIVVLDEIHAAYLAGFRKHTYYMTKREEGDS